MKPAIAREVPEAEKLSNLRAKTDRQILEFIESKLDAAWRFMSLAEAEFSQANRAFVRQLLDKAGQALREAQTLLLVLDERQRRELDGKFDRISQALERALCDPEDQTHCSQSA